VCGGVVVGVVVWGCGGVDVVGMCVGVVVWGMWGGVGVWGCGGVGGVVVWGVWWCGCGGGGLPLRSNIPRKALCATLDTYNFENITFQVTVDPSQKNLS
jgi:hypothetical protein